MARVYRKGNTWVCSSHGPIHITSDGKPSCGCDIWGIPGKSWYGTVKPLNPKAQLPSVNRRDAK